MEEVKELPSPTTGLYKRQQDLVDLTKSHPFVCAYGSSRGGKSWTFIKLMVLRAQRFPGSSHLIVRKTSASVKTTIWKTLIAVLKDMGIYHTVSMNSTEYTIRFENDSEIVCGGVQDDQLDKILGSEWQTIFFNEATNISYDAYETVTTRLNGNWFDARGTRCELKVYIDCNPTTYGSWIYKLFLEQVVPGTKRELEGAEEYGWLKFDADSNPSVDPAYYRRLRNKSKTNQARFLEGEWSPEVEGALFRMEDIERYRQAAPSKEKFDMIVVSVDPATTSLETSDETGIIVAGVLDKHVYILEDLSCRKQPEEWGNIVVKAYREWGAACVRIETNQGGDAWSSIIRQIDRSVTIKHYHAAAGMGKNVRAQPVAAEMAAGRIHLPFEPMEELEAQLIVMTGDFDRNPKRNKSPDRLDAMVYAVAELVLADNGPSGVMLSKPVGIWQR